MIRRILPQSLFLLVLCHLFIAVAWSEDRGFSIDTLRPRWTVGERAYAWSPDGKLLAYMIQDGIWMVEAPDFRSPRRLIRKGYCAGGSCPGAQLLWSPDGKRLAFSDSRPGDGWSTIWVMKADGSKVREVLRPGVPVPGAGNRAVAIGTWLNNRELAFYAYCGTGCLALYKIDVDTLSLHLFRACEMDGAVSWAPTKQWAAVELHLGALGLIKRTDTRAVTPAALADLSPCMKSARGCFPGSVDWEGTLLNAEGWSPDGKQLLYTSLSCAEVMGEGPTQFTLHRWNVRTGRHEPIARNAFGGTWSPDGTRIAFLLIGAPQYDKQQRIVGTDAVSTRPARLSVVLMNIATRKSQVMPLGTDAVNRQTLIRWERSEAMRPQWSPDGQYLAVPNINGTLSLVRTDGSKQRSFAVPSLEAVTWSPDSQHLAVRMRDGGVEGGDGEEAALLQFLPPVGKEEAKVPEAEIIRRYFLKALTPPLDALVTFSRREYFMFLEVQAHLLERQGKKAEALAYVCNGLLDEIVSRPGGAEALTPGLRARYAECPLRPEIRNLTKAFLPQPRVDEYPDGVLSDARMKRRKPWGSGVSDSKIESHQHGEMKATEPVRKVPSLYIINVPDQ